MPIWPLSGRIDKCPQFCRIEGPAVMSAIELHISTLEMLKRVLDCPAVSDHPASELLRGLEIEVAGLNADPILSPS